ncbi:hypothetical protein JCM3770_001740 [Rhodotorula araucariae]
MDAATVDADTATLDDSNTVSPEAARSPAKAFAFAQKRAASPAFAVSPEYSADSFDCEDTTAIRTLRAKGAFAPTSARTESPGPLLWSESGWHAGSFTFAPLAAPDSATSHRSPEEQSMAAVTNARSSDGGNSGAASGAGAVAKGLASSTLPTAGGPAAPVKATRSKLAPTAQPFAPKVTPLTPVTPRPRAPALDIVTSLERYTFPTATAYNDHSATSSPLEPVTPHSHRHPSHSSISCAVSQFDPDGRLLSQGAKYTIADEILQLQSASLDSGVHSNEVETLELVDPGPPGMRMRAVSEDSTLARGIETWRQQQPPAFPLVAAARRPGVGVGQFERSRSSSLASAASSYFAPVQGRLAFESASTVAQLQSYFGTSPGDVSVQLPGGFDTYAPAHPVGHSAPLSRQPSYASLPSAGAVAAAYPPLAHPEPFNLTADDPLYIEARNVFVESSCTSLTTPATPAHRQTMGAHFDRAMHQLHPLATLYGLSQDAANQLLADPTKSGVNDVVLKVAAMMGRQQQMASVQRSAMGAILPGPSPNNRKLALYKTELCRSWDERSGCRYGIKCQFAHGVHELREIVRHPKFKSEICRTFWQQGACPYGKRCCFIHAMPDAPSPLASPHKDSVASSRAASPRLQGRMTSTAVTGAPSRTFGPALSELISSSSSSSSATSSPVKASHKDKDSAPPGSAPSSTSSFETSTLFGLGIRERPGQAPPAFRDAPQSRLQRLASLSAGPSSSSLASLGQPSPTVAATGAWNGGPHVRHDSTNSFVSSGSSVPSLAHSPLLARTGSSSSLSSAANSPVLHRVAGDWLSGPAHHTGKSAALDWPAIEELSLDDPPATVGSALHGRAAFA